MEATAPVHSITFDDVTLICTRDEVPAVLDALDNHAAQTGHRPPIILRVDEISKAIEPDARTAAGLAKSLRAATRKP